MLQISKIAIKDKYTKSPHIEDNQTIPFMYCSNGSSSMATLLQQKNCMKSLTNGGGGNGNAGQGARVLLPHEMVSIPISPMTTSGSTLSTGVHSLSTVQHHHNQNLQQQQQQQQQPPQFSNYNFYNSIHSNNDSATTFRQPSTSNINLQHPHHISHNSALTSSVPFMNQSDNSDTATTDNTNGDQIKTEVKLEDDVDVNVNSEQNLIQQMDEDEQEPEPEIDIVINNVVCSFSVRCHLNLREIALNGINVEFRRENGMVTMKLRRPYTTASIWSSGRITCTGATSEDQVSHNYNAVSSVFTLPFQSYLCLTILL